jgi:hypothetical protein
VNEALWKYVGQISGVLSICGAVIVIVTALVLTEVNRFCHTHFSSAEITWVSFLAGVGVAGLISAIYGVGLNRKIVGGGDQNKQAFIAVLSGLVLMAVAGLGVAVPTSSGGGSSAPARHACTQSSTAISGNNSKGHSK